MLHLSPSCNEHTLPHTYKHPFPPLFTAHIDHLSWNGIVTEAKSRWDPVLFHNNNFFNWASLPISPQPVLFIFAKIRDGILIDTCWVYDFESWGVQLLREIAIASVGSIVVSRGLDDKKNIKLIMNSVSQRVVSCGRWRLDRHQTEKYTPWRDGRTEDAVGICVIRRSVSLAAGSQRWTAAEVAGFRSHHTPRESLRPFWNREKTLFDILTVSFIIVISHISSHVRLSYCKFWVCRVPRLSERSQLSSALPQSNSLTFWEIMEVDEKINATFMSVCKYEATASSQLA